jgi:hypothetical protein
MGISIAEIREITDPEELSNLIDELRTNLRLIEAQLEWKETDDPEWEARAISALGYHRVSLGEALRRERKITGKSADSQKAAAERQLAKAIRKETAATIRANDLEERKLREYRRRNELHAYGLKLLESVSSDAAFRRSAQRLLDPETYEAIEDATKKAIYGAVRIETASIQREKITMQPPRGQLEEPGTGDEVAAASQSAGLTQNKTEAPNEH